MKRILFFSFLSILTAMLNCVFAQEDLTLEKLKEIELNLQSRMDSIAESLKAKAMADDTLLVEKIDSIKQLYKEAKSELRKRDSIDYFKIYNPADEIFTHGDIIQVTVSNNELEDEIKKTIKKIGDKRSPTDNSFGKSFMDVITEEAKNMFSSSDFKSPNDVKKTWSSVVDKIVNNDVVSGLLKSNPITSTISGIVTTAASFVDNQMEGSKKAKDIKLATKEVFTKNKITSFQERLTPFLSYYYKLDEASRAYDLSQKQFDIRFENFINSSKTIYSDFISDAGYKDDFDIKKTEYFTNMLFERYKGNSISYSDILAKKEVIKISKYTSNWNIMLSQYKSYLIERDNITIAYFENVETALKGYISEIENKTDKEGNKIKYKVKFDSKKVNEFVTEVNKTKKKIESRRDNLEKNKDVIKSILNYQL